MLIQNFSLVRAGTSTSSYCMSVASSLHLYQSCFTKVLRSDIRTGLISNFETIFSINLWSFFNYKVVLLQETIRFMKRILMINIRNTQKKKQFREEIGIKSKIRFGLIFASIFFIVEKTSSNNLQIFLSVDHYYYLLPCVACMEVSSSKNEFPSSPIKFWKKMYVQLNFRLVEKLWA